MLLFILLLVHYLLYSETLLFIHHNFNSGCRGVLRNFVSSCGHVISLKYLMLYLLLPLQTTTPRTLKPTIRVTTTLMPQTTTSVNKTTGHPTTTNSSLTEVTSSNRASSSTWSTSSGLSSVSSTVTPGKYGKVISWYTTATQKVIWQPAVIECTHIFSTYVVTNVFHFLAFFTGFYMFRIQESEGLNALIEKARMISCSVWQMPFLLRDYPKSKYHACSFLRCPKTFYFTTLL